MIIVQKETTPIADECILLGRQCENEARQVQFDLSWLIGEYGSGTATLVHKRNKDTAPYICTATQTGNTLTWTLDNQDTAYDGWGKAELRWTVGDVLAKTLIYKTMVIRSITADTTIPEPLESWYDQMIDYIDTHGGGGGGTTDYSALSNKPSINDVTLSGNKTAADLGLGTYSKPSGGIPKTDLASGVQASLDKADSALQTAPVSSVDGKTGSVTVLPSGGTEGQVLKKSSGADYAVEWDDSTGGIDATGDGTVTIVEAGGEIGVNSVNGKTGVVTLTATDVGALPNNYTPPVSSVNGQTGAVSLSIPTVDANLNTAGAAADAKAAGDAISALSGGLQDKLDAPSTAGTSGQVLTSDGEGGQSWQTPQSGGSVSPYTSTPAALGTASPGSSDNYARGDHVHPKPTAADLGITVPSASSATPQALGTAAAGSSSDYSRADHVHAKPTASDIGAIAAPVSPSIGQYISWDGSAWVAANLPVYSGGVG